MRVKLALFSLFFLAAFSSAANERSPFTGVNFSEYPSIKVTHEGTEYYLLNIDGVKRADIMSACESLYPNDCADRFTFGFVGLLSSLNIAGTDWSQDGALDFVNLKLYNVQNHSITDFSDVSVTEEKLSKIIGGLQ